ncbi:hypothetical protein PybrP1_004162 [[Pythium] brassicae (nom. inval.)]|nr:hypothetical protein PybrP1_004162 [[Pythium] brassicae (nom. inval.)]
MEQRVMAFAAASRAAVTLIALLTARLVTPYDTSTRLAAGSAGPYAAAFANWDGVYFTQIAARGYDYEQMHAFFPLYPLLMRALSNASFVLAALWLYRLGRLVLGDEAVARRAAYLFCIAPSSIFMSAVYSESFGGMLCLERHKRSGRFSELLLCAVAFGCASATRSNGALLSLFIAWHRLCASPPPRAAPAACLRHWAATALLGVVAVGPQVVYFGYGLSVYCPSLLPAATTAASQAPSLLTGDRSWCAHAVPNLSAMYVFVQREYWNVGLFQYYELKQAPNFLLASPIVALSAHSLLQFARSAARPGEARPGEAPYYAHWLFLLVNALLVVHIQVTTRLLCACPPLFWAPAAFAVREVSSTGDRNAGTTVSKMSTKGALVVGYFLLYTVLGSVLFPAFYPWT